MARALVAVVMVQTTAVTEEGSPARLAALNPVPPLLVIFSWENAQ